MNGQVGWTGLATSLILVAVAAAISLWQRLGLERQLVWAAARALAQLLLVGGALTLLFAPGRCCGGRGHGSPDGGLRRGCSPPARA